MVDAGLPAVCLIDLGAGGVSASGPLAAKPAAGRGPPQLASCNRSHWARYAPQHWHPSGGCPGHPGVCAGSGPPSITVAAWRRPRLLKASRSAWLGAAPGHAQAGDYRRLVGKLSPAQTFTQRRPPQAAAVNPKVGVGVVGRRKSGCLIWQKAQGAQKKSCLDQIRLSSRLVTGVVGQATCGAKQVAEVVSPIGGRWPAPPIRALGHPLHHGLVPGSGPPSPPPRATHGWEAGAWRVEAS